MTKHYIDGCEIPEKAYLKIKHKCDMWYKESQKLQQENQQLKEQLENASKNYTKYIQERDNVLDEIREYCNEYGAITPQEQDILQILDKVKE